MFCCLALFFVSLFLSLKLNGDFTASSINAMHDQTSRTNLSKSAHFLVCPFERDWQTGTNTFSFSSHQTVSYGRHFHGNMSKSPKQAKILVWLNRSLFQSFPYISHQLSTSSSPKVVVVVDMDISLFPPHHHHHTPNSEEANWDNWRHHPPFKSTLTTI